MARNRRQFRRKKCRVSDHKARRSAALSALFRVIEMVAGGNPLGVSEYTLRISHAKG